MFTSIIGTTLTLQSFIICFMASVLCGFIISFAYKLSYKSSENFLSTTALLPRMVMTVIMMVNRNLGIGIAVAGSFSLIRFRSLPGRASDIGTVFLAMAAGLACGTGYVSFALVLAVLCSVLMMFLSRTTIFSRKSTYKYLRIRVPEDMEFTPVFESALAKYSDRTELISCKTANLGSVYELCYELKLKEGTQLKDLMDEMRLLNGNLAVNINTNAPASSEL